MRHNLKSERLNPYQKSTWPFWRLPENKGKYSQKSIDYFEERAAEFERTKRTIQWIRKDQTL